jgi:hypothetical protein
MEYVVRQPRTKSLLVPALALVIGAAGAVGINAVLDDTDVSTGPARVIVSEPVTPGAGVAAKDEAATAAAIGRSTAGSISINPSTGFPVGETKDEAATAAAIGYPTLSSAEAEAQAKQQASTGAPVGIPSPAAAAKLNGDVGSGTASKDEAGTAAAIGNGSSEDEDPFTARTGRPGGP